MDLNKCIFTSGTNDNLCRQFVWRKFPSQWCIGIWPRSTLHLNLSSGFSFKTKQINKYRYLLLLGRKRPLPPPPTHPYPTKTETKTQTKAKHKQKHTVFEKKNYRAKQWELSDTALSAITTAGAMIHGRIHLGMSWWAINHFYCKTSAHTKSNLFFLWLFEEVYGMSVCM